MDHFRISHVHTRRRQGHLYAALEKRNGCPVLLHITNESRAEIEVQALTSLKCTDRVLQMVGNFPLKGDKHGDKQGIVYEYVRRSYLLSNVMKSLSTTFTEACIVYILQQLVLTLVDLHKVGIVHCDVCASNVFINAEGKMKLIQFGSSHRERGSRPRTRSLRDSGEGRPSEDGVNSDLNISGDSISLQSSPGRRVAGGPI